MKILSDSPELVGVYIGDMVTNLQSHASKECRHLEWRSLLVDGPQKIETRDDLQFWLVRLNDGAHDSDINILSTNVMC